MASEKPILFPYGTASGRPSPIVPVGLLINGQWQVVEFYVDSGAFYTLVHAQFAIDSDMEWKRGRKVFAQVGDGSLIPIFYIRFRCR